MRQLNSKLPVVRSGITGGSVAQNSYKDFNVNFGADTFTDIPAVTATLCNATTYYSAYANVQIFILNVTKTFATIRIMNGYEYSGVEPYVTWIAIGR